MRLISPLTLALSALTTSSAQSTTTQTGPFTLDIVSDDPALSGGRLSSCHAGAAIEGLCFGKPTAGAPPSSSSTYWLNTTYYQGSTEPNPGGSLIWNLPLGGDTPSNVSSALSIGLSSVTSNVIVPLFYPGNDTQSPRIAFEQGPVKGGKVGITGYFYNEAQFKPGVHPGSEPGTGEGSSGLRFQWAVCWAITGGYYYQVLAWITAGVPSNPTCAAVNVTATPF